MLEPFPWKNRGLADSKQLPKPGFSLSCSRIPLIRVSDSCFRCLGNYSIISRSTVTVTLRCVPRSYGLTYRRGWFRNGKAKYFGLRTKRPIARVREGPWGNHPLPTLGQPWGKLGVVLYPTRVCQRNVHRPGGHVRIGREPADRTSGAVAGPKDRINLSRCAWDHSLLSPRRNEHA